MWAGLQRNRATLVSIDRAELSYEGPMDAVQQMHCMAANTLPAQYTSTDDAVRDLYQSCLKMPDADSRLMMHGHSVVHLASNKWQVESGHAGL